jgi:hypothetical protein
MFLLGWIFQLTDKRPRMVIWRYRATSHQFKYLPTPSEKKNHPTTTTICYWLFFDFYLPSQSTWCIRSSWHVRLCYLLLPLENFFSTSYLLKYKLNYFTFVSLCNTSQNIERYFFNRTRTYYQESLILIIVHARSKMMNNRNTRTSFIK